MARPELTPFLSEEQRKEGVAAAALSLGATMDLLQKIEDLNTTPQEEQEIIEALERKSGKKLKAAA